MKEMADMASKDVSLSAKVLKMANSPFYNLLKKEGDSTNAWC